MKRKILSLLLSFTLCLTLLPMAAFAEEPDKISITTVDELLQFAKAVDNGEYDDKTDAVVSLDADLDLTGVAWKPIGSVFDGDGNLLHYFSGKFYGNGHTISNLDFSENYGMAEYPVFGFFSVAYGAEISGQFKASWMCPIQGMSFLEQLRALQKTAKFLTAFRMYRSRIRTNISTALRLCADMR